MRTLTVKLYNSDDFGYLGDMINIAGIILILSQNIGL